MGKFARRPVMVDAVQWWPPEDARHDPHNTPLKWPGVHCLSDFGCACPDQRECNRDDHKVRDGDIGWQEDRGTNTYWVRKNNSTAQYLKPGDWIVRGDSWPIGVEAMSSDLFARVYEPVR